MYAKLLPALQKRIESEDFLQRHRASPNAFTRERTLCFRTVVLLLLNLLKGSLQDELDGFFKALGGFPVAARVVTKSAFSQARRKLRHGAFLELNALVTTFFYKHTRAQLWHGLRVLAIDGSTAQLPRTEAIAKHFGGLPGKRGGLCPLARVSQMYDVLNRITVAATIAPYAAAERDLAASHIQGLTGTDLVLLDRGYPGFWFFSLLNLHGIQFCARVMTDYNPAVSDFVASGKAERIIRMSPAPAAR